MNTMRPVKPVAYKFLTVILIVTLLAIVGCSKNGEQAKKKAKVDPQTLVISNAHNTFGLELFKTLVAQSDGENVVISPTSIALALTMVYNGADKNTRDEMRQALALQNLNIDALNESSKKLIDSLEDDGGDFTLDIANAIWAQKGFTVSQDFITKNQEFFNADVSTIDFNDSNTPNVINKWASDNTNNKIKKIVKDTRGLAVLIANATYFKGSWTKEFDKDKTYKAKFNNADGTESEVELMSKFEELSYKETDEYQAVNLGYGENGRLSMHVFLPNDLDAFVKNLDSAKWKELLGGFEETKIRLGLPKFKTTYSQKLNDSLETLGMKEAFDRDKADFSGIGKDLFISFVKHDTFLEINESGTEAAAVTNAGMMTTSAPNNLAMIVDKPFFLAITDSVTNEILFAGVINSL